jgi:hypothetical protein
MVMANSEKTGEQPDAATAVKARIAATLIFLVMPDIKMHSVSSTMTTRLK